MTVMSSRSLPLVIAVVSVVGTGCNARGMTTASASPQPQSPCRAEQLRLEVGPDFGALGTEHQYFSLTNTGSGSCTLTGYPGVSFVARDGRVVADNFERASDPP